MNLFDRPFLQHESLSEDLRPLREVFRHGQRVRRLIWYQSMRNSASKRQRQDKVVQGLGPRKNHMIRLPEEFRRTWVDRNQSDVVSCTLLKHRAVRD